MLTAENNTTAEIISVPTTAESIDNLLQKEWLLTNGRSGYSSSTVLCCNTRGYHGLLVGSLRPPADRIMALSACLDMVVCTEGIFHLSAFEFADRFAPDNFACIKKFRRDSGVHSIASVWRRHRVSCPTRQDLSNYLLQILSPEQIDYLEFHVETVGCRYCLANLEDLKGRQSEGSDAVVTRRRKYFQSSAGYLRKK